MITVHQYVSRAKKSYRIAFVYFVGTSDSSLILLTDFTVMRPCSHVVCKTCTDTLVKDSKQCVVCDTQLEGKDIIELMREGRQIHFWTSIFIDVEVQGTGFAGGGLAETSKAGIAFQG